MKKTLFIFIGLFLSHVAQATEIRLNSISSDVFTYEMVDQYLTINFTDKKENITSKAALTNTSSEEKKIAIVDGKKTIEALLVLTASGHETATLLVFVPYQSETVVNSSQTQAVCSLVVTGNFELSNENLKSSLLIKRKGAKTELVIRANGEDKNCFAF